MKIPQCYFFSTEGDTDPENYIKCINDTTKLDFD